ncbi:GNAT family N-acetyltransferase [Leptospira sp. 201903071]|uniref:GNAT family N-acetyltransferase n=1 Tax=Leptospira ainazelensis TaxID=2810034 RepID=UPI0019658E35|nr:GNAT family N-acetyltransferase [Leptospira ainazelensis]MBM9501956.1 GNAT family N-acetyltransferase [Leptospira ainazelensis]
MIGLRSVTAEDEDLLLEWANDPAVRQMAFDPTMISAEGHKEWFHSKLKDPNTKMYILEENNVPIGQIRFDLNEKDGSYYIDYSIDRNFRGKGYGNSIVIQGLEFHRNLNVIGSNYKALVKESNAASVQCFIKSGFRQISKSPECIVFVKD